MELGLLFLTSLRGKKTYLWISCFLLCIVAAEGKASHGHSTLSVSAPHLYYTCPQGANVKLLCNQRGAPSHPKDILRHSWLFTAHSDQRCSGSTGPRHITVGHHPHANRTLPPGLQFGAAEHSFWVSLQNVTYADQGRYCCLLFDVHVENKHPTLADRTHSHVVLQVTPERNGSQECTVWDPAASENSVPVALAVAPCILALLCLPLILLLVYKQRQTSQSSRRAQELVRMDSEAQGHENPVFLGESPQNRTRTVSQIMARQSSETGRHLLSEPGTPLTPPVQGDVFFPIEDTILESPELVQI